MFFKLVANPKNLLVFGLFVSILIFNSLDTFTSYSYCTVSELNKYTKVGVPTLISNIYIHLYCGNYIPVTV